MPRVKGEFNKLGGGDFGDARAEAIPLGLSSLALVITVSIVIYFVVNYFIKQVFKPFKRSQWKNLQFQQ